MYLSTRYIESGTSTCRVYPFPLPSVWTCRVYPFPPPCQQWSGFWSVRHRKEQNCWYRKQSNTKSGTQSGTGLRYWMPECQGRRHRPRCRCSAMATPTQLTVLCRKKVRCLSFFLPWLSICTHHSNKEPILKNVQIHFQLYNISWWFFSAPPGTILLSIHNMLVKKSDFMLGSL